MTGKQWKIRWLPFLVFAAVSLQFRPVFAQGVTFTTNWYNTVYAPFFVSIANLNGDKKPDLICEISPPPGGAFVIALTNSGAGIFTTNGTRYGSEGFLLCVVTGGINGGGRPDLIFQSSSLDSLDVVTNNGSGIFGYNATYTIGGNPISALATDVNGDGKVDLVSVNEDDNTLTVLTNNGSGVFGSNATYSVGNFPASVVAADIDGDGSPDLICVNEHDNTLTVLTNIGSGLFGSNATLHVGNSPRRVVAADINGDGKPDLISANYSDGTLTVLTNNGYGVFGSNATLNVGGGSESLLAADVNGDGKMDLVSANTTSGKMSVLINTTPFPPPSLSVTLGGGQIGLSWPGWATNYVLESTTNLSVPDWVAVTNGTSITGYISLTNAWPAAFFRLHQY